MHSALLEGDQPGSVAVMLHPAKQLEIASLFVQTYGLSKREREVIRLVLAGPSTQEMADDLCGLSLYRARSPQSGIRQGRRS